MVTRVSEQIYKQNNAAQAKKIWGDILINVKVYGAKGDGNTDDTAAFQDAINYAISVGMNTIWIPAGDYVYGTLTNTDGIYFVGDGVTLDGDTPLQLINLAEQLADVATIYLSQMPKVSNEDDTDYTLRFQKAIDDLALVDGGEILIGSDIYIDNVQFRGTMSSNKNKIIVTCHNDAKIFPVSSKTSGALISLGNTSTDTSAQYLIEFRHLFIDCLLKDITGIDGDVGSGNITCLMEYVKIINFNGVNSIGLDMGRMTDSKINTITVQGGTGNIGIKGGRSTNQLINADIRYCTHGVYIPGGAGQSEKCIQMIGGGILVCTNLITFEGGDGTTLLSNVSYFKGTFLAEQQFDNTKIFNVVTPNGCGLGTIVFEGCLFNTSNTSENMIVIGHDTAVDYSADVLFLGCKAFTGSTNNNVSLGRHINLYEIGNSNIVFIHSRNNKYNVINQSNEFMLQFKKAALAQSLNASSMDSLLQVTSYTMPKSGIVTQAFGQLSATLTTGTINIVIDRFDSAGNHTFYNIVGVGTVFSPSGNNKSATIDLTTSNYVFNKGDFLKLIVYTSADLQVGLNLDFGIMVKM